ncbi:MAG: alpha/beta hydrolase [Rhodobacteraceae bacterium]|nr:alpha/beta hydrolase [Paracoccaceae bacterium]MAY45173.1 alpha/beta hydrolase [Paracoccaceae bacterium]
MQLLHSKIAGGGIAVHDLGGNGPPVIFLHGLGGSGTLEFPAVAGHAALCGHRRILFDWPGHGASDAPKGFDYSTTSLARVALELIDRLCPGQDVTVFGHSMGGAIAIELAELLGERCTGLILAEGNTRSGGGMFSAKIAAWSLAEYVDRAHPTMLTEDLAAARIWNMADAWSVHRCAQALVAGVHPEWMDRLMALTIPRAAIFSDTNANHPDVALLTDAGIPVHVLPDSGHGMALDNPAGLADLLSLLLAKEISS